MSTGCCNAFYCFCDSFDPEPVPCGATGLFCPSLGRCAVGCAANTEFCCGEREAGAGDGEREEGGNKEEILEKLKQMDQQDGVECLLCELVIQAVDFQLESEATVETVLIQFLYFYNGNLQVRDALFAVCDQLQPGMEEDCKAIMFQLDLATIIALLVELGLRPHAVCRTLGFCQ